MSNIKNNSFSYLSTTHQFHLVDPSPWPLLASLRGFMLTTGLVSYMHKMLGGWSLFLNGFVVILFVMYIWWRDIVKEATYEEHHTFMVQRGLIRSNSMGNISDDNLSKKYDRRLKNIETYLTLQNKNKLSNPQLCNIL